MDKIVQLYNQRSYINVHGYDIVLSILPILMTLFIVSYATYSALIAKIKDNWSLNRCNPIYMPFAGIIMPEADVSPIESTIDNFTYCIKQDTSMVFSIALMPFEFSMHLIIDFLNTSMKTIVVSMRIAHWIRSQIGGIVGELYSKLFNVVIPIIVMITYIRDTLARTTAVLLVSLYTIMNVYNTTISGLVNLMNVFNDLIVSMIAILIATMLVAVALMITPLFPVGATLYVTSMITLTVIIVPAIIIYSLLKTFVKSVAGESSRSTPKKPKVPKKKKRPRFF